MRSLLSREALGHLAAARRVLAAARRVLAAYPGTRVVDWRGGVLVVGVASPSLRADLAMSSGEIRDAVNALVGEDLVKEVRVVGA